MIEVSNNIDIYGYEMEMEMETSVAGEDSSKIVKSNGNGYIDIKNKKMKISTNINETHKEKSKLTHTEIYIFDDIVYMLSEKDCNWIKFEVPGNKLDSENQLKKQMKLVMTSKIKSIKEGSFKNIDCYLLGIEPDKDAFWKVIMEQEEEHPLMKLLDLDYENVVKDMDMKLWISKDKFFPMKCIMGMKAVIEKEIMKAPFKMIINVKKIYTYHDYIKLRAIELPEQAKKAKVYNEEEWD
ncbi:MAG: hypothetical protein LWX01_05775 [Deltaproteobacteria bacterium]|nr:hypothetical protein [Deltaproteobacteria bacterium]MDL1961196.1 hypothetical protein [Deltaproteobacteria bacterium]